jgi:hypothetical protein
VKRGRKAPEDEGRKPAEGTRRSRKSRELRRERQEQADREFREVLALGDNPDAIDLMKALRDNATTPITLEELKEQMLKEREVRLLKKGD